MRAFSVSVRIRRLPMNSMRSMTNCCGADGGCAGAACEGACAWSSIASSPVSRSRDREKRTPCEDGDCGAFSASAAGQALAKTKTSATTCVTRAANTPNGEQTLLLAAEEPIKAAPPNSRCHSPAGPGTGRLCVVSDSLVDDRGCLADRTERQPLPGDINLECRGPLNSTLDQRLGERVFNVLLQSPAQRARTVAAVRARFLEDPLASLRR